MGGKRCLLAITETIIHRRGGERWLIFAKRQGEYLPLFTDTEVNNCFSIYQPVDSQHQIVRFFLKMGENARMKSGAMLGGK